MSLSSFIFLGILGFVIAQIIYLSLKMERVSDELEAVWDFLIRRAKVAIVQKGFGTMHSQIKINVESLAKILPLLTQMLPFYADTLKQRPDISEKQLFIEFEKKFGDYIIEAICIPSGNMNVGECLIMVMEGCKKILEATQGAKI